MGDVGEYWNDHRDYVRRKCLEGPPIIRGVKHANCGGEIMEGDVRRNCCKCGRRWKRDRDAVEMVGPRMGAANAEAARG